MGFQRRQHHLLFKERIPARDKAGLPGKPQHCHQDEEKCGHHFRVAVKGSRKSHSGTGNSQPFHAALEAPSQSTNDIEHSRSL